MKLKLKEAVAHLKDDAKFARIGNTNCVVNCADLWMVLNEAEDLQANTKEAIDAELAEWHDAP